MASKIISLVQVKGGCGRSTVACNLAAELAKVGSTLLIDADMPQGSTASWAAVRQQAGLLNGLKVETVSTYKELIGHVERNSKAQFVVIDTAPRLAEIARAAIVLADLTITPVTPSMVDLWATTDVVGLLDLAAKAKGVKKINARMLWNKHRAGTSAKLMEYAQAEIPVPFLNSTLGNRVAYTRAASDGKSAAEVRDPVAAGELLALVKEVRGILK